MMLFTRFAALFFLVLTASSTYADRAQGFYLGIGGMLLDVNAIDISASEVEFKVAEGLMGYRFNNWVTFEVRAGASANDELILLSEEPGAGTAKVNIDSYYAAYYRAEIANEIAKAYLLAGVVEMNVSFYETADRQGTFEERSSDGFSYGAGVGFILGKRMNLNFEWRSLIDSENDLFVSFGTNIDYRF